MGKCVKIATFIVGVMALSLLGTGSAKADIGPAQIYAEGGALKPASDTNISMESEKVILTYKPPEALKTESGVEPTIMRAHVVARFKMKNPSKDKQSLKLYFPADDGQYAGGMGMDENITSFSVNGAKLSGGIVDAKIDKDTFGYGNKYDNMMIKAYQWDQTFPAGETTITVEYDTMSGKDFEMFDLTYVLGTGRNWAGPIKSGEIDFVFPDKVQPYAVSSDAPMLKENKLSYTLDDKTIKVAFTDYEPASGDVIVLGLADPSVVSEVEKAKQVKPQTLDSTVRLASLFRGLSVGAHCYLCVEPSAEISKSYYTQAFNMAKSKDEVNKVMQSLAFGGQTSENHTFAKMYGWFDFFTKNRFCDINDGDCNSEMYVFSNVTPFGPSQSTMNTPANADLLALYACRLRPYDLATSVLVEDYTGKRYESCPTKEPQADQNAMTTPSETKNAVAQSAVAQGPINWWLLAGVVAASWAVLGLVIGAIAAIKRHRRNKSSKRGASSTTDVKPAKKEPKTEEK